jgi:hypothetical protein
MILILSSRKGSLPMVRLIRFLKGFFSLIFYVLRSQINAFNIDFMKAPFVENQRASQDTNKNYSRQTKRCKTDQGNRCRNIFWVEYQFESILHLDLLVTFPEQEFKYNRAFSC